MKMSKLEQMHAQMLARKLEKQKGASMIEYALILGAVVGIGAVFFNTTDGTIYTAIQTKLQGVADDL
ncbi:Flp family type IVb pilin [Thiomicrospira sp.]|uniref:Flp family type IVb pilin n=1 Tax=Thiomicrospira sp. TaxID=935 RepID=UPI002F95C0D4